MLNFKLLTPLCLTLCSCSLWIEGELDFEGEERARQDGSLDMTLEEPSDAELMRDMLIAGEPMAGEPVAGEPVAGEPMAGEPAIYRPDELFPSQGCVGLSQEGACVIPLNSDVTLRCQTHQDVINVPNDGQYQRAESCSPSLPSGAELAQAERLINALRAEMGSRELEMNANRRHGECAIITDAVARVGSWTETDPCFDLISPDSFNPADDVAHIGGFWTPFDLSHGLLSAVRGRLIKHRHWLLNPQVEKVKAGFNLGGSCLSTEPRDISVAVPLSYYPGAGYVPRSLLHAGDHRGEAPAWSVSLTDELATELGVELITLTEPGGEGTPRAITTTTFTDQPHVLMWTLDEPAQDGETFEVRVSWVDALGVSQSLKLYSSIVSCGPLMPERCDPSRVDECVVDGNSCVYWNYVDEEPGWYCQRTGPLSSGQLCADYSGSCSGESICVAPTSDDESTCAQRCVLNDDTSPNRCELLCSSFTQVGEVAGSLIGVCNP